MVSPRAGGILAKIVRAFDEPFGDDSTVPSYFVCQAARQNVTVALSGLGGDEAFAGYSRYVGFHVSQLYNRLPMFLRGGVIRRLVERVPEGWYGGNKVSHLKRFVRSAGRDDAHRYLGFIAKLSDHYRTTFFSGAGSRLSEGLDAAQERFVKMFQSAPAEHPLNKVFYCDIKTYLPDDILACTDRMSMQHSLEVRVPFLNHQLLEYSATIPPDMKLKLFRPKHLLKKCVADLLPAPVLRHRKQGFVGPTEVWLKGELRAFTEEKLSAASLARHGMLDHKTIHTILQDHYTDKENNDVLIWCLLNFQVWFEEYMT
jgi:asparagine synthase (glutamine-hydrolysing)